MTTTTHKEQLLDALHRAQHLTLPTRQAMLQRAPEVSDFWQSNRQLLEEAWQLWDTNPQTRIHKPDTFLLDSKLRHAVEQAWQDPSKEQAVKDLWTEVSPGVFQAQFFDPEKLHLLRDYLAAAAEAGIPTRPPYGIALNRHGAMLDARSEGYLAAPSFQHFYQTLMNNYMRPIARLLFPNIIGYDSQTFGFSIQYQAGVDTSLQPHSDASAATLNINMNLPDESFTGSEVDFYDHQTNQVNRLSFTPGSAILHKGSVPHATQPILSGSRSNMVLWLYGERMQIPMAHQAQTLPLDAAERWQIPKTAADQYAPF